MKSRKIPFSPPDVSETEANEIRDAILTGWITTGPKTKQFERLLANYVNLPDGESLPIIQHGQRCPSCVCLNSQTACAEMALSVLGIGPGDEVIVPAFTYTATASVVLHVGAKLVFVDICKNDENGKKFSLEMDYNLLDSAITERTKAIIPVDLAGIPCDYDRIYQIVKSHKHQFHPSNDIQAKLGRIAVCADSAHALGAIWHERKVGSVADFSNFSFHAVKNFTTAEGGAMTWNLPFGNEIVEHQQKYLGSDIPVVEGETWNDFIYRLAQLISMDGQSRDAFSKNKLGAWEYDIIGPWKRCNMTDIIAAIGIAQFYRYPKMLLRRKQLIEKMNEAFVDLPLAVLDHYSNNYSGSGHLYMVRLNGFSRERTNYVICQMAERGITCNVHYKPLPMMTAYKSMGYDILNYPNAFAVFRNELSLPLFTKLTDEDLQYVISNFIDIVKK